MRRVYLFTYESGPKQSDKVADQISDAIVDLFLSKDPEARVACETMTTTNRVVLAGEIRGTGIMDREGNWAPGIREEIEHAVRDTVRSIGYEQEGFHWDKFDSNIARQCRGHRAGRRRARKKERATATKHMFGLPATKLRTLRRRRLHHKILM